MLLPLIAAKGKVLSAVWALEKLQSSHFFCCRLKIMSSKLFQNPILPEALVSGRQ
jgi:hypothetical protein